MLNSPETWVALSFLVFVGVIVWKALKPILAALDKRSERIRKDIEEAAQLREEAEKTLADYKRKQREAHKQAEEILDHARQEAKRMQERAAANLEEQLRRREQASLERIAQAEAQALQEVRNQAVEVALAATARLLQEKVTAAEASSLVDQTISDLPNRLN